VKVELTLTELTNTGKVTRSEFRNLREEETLTIVYNSKIKFTSIYINLQTHGFTHLEYSEAYCK
jgi:hypothetical protein